MKRTLILLAFLAGCCIMWETATADPGGGKPPPHPLPPTPSFKPAPHIVGHKVTPHPASSDFHLPENFHALGPLPKVTLPKGPSFGGGTLDLKGLNLPHESGLLAYQPKLPSGFKPISGMEFHKNLSGAMLKHPTKIDDVNLSLKKFHSHTLLVKKNLHKHYLMNPWFAQNWWLNHNFVYPYWHYFHHFHLHPPWWWWQHAAWIDCIHWMVYDWGDPFYYDCGVNILYRDNWVYVNDVAVATSIDYAYQAFQLAAVPPPPPEENLEWMPLGVYTLASSRTDPDPDLILQLCAEQGRPDQRHTLQPHDKRHGGRLGTCGTTNPASGDPAFRQRRHRHGYGFLQSDLALLVRVHAFRCLADADVVSGTSGSVAERMNGVTRKWRAMVAIARHGVMGPSGQPVFRAGTQVAPQRNPFGERRHNTSSSVTSSIVLLKVPGNQHVWGLLRSARVSDPASRLTEGLPEAPWTSALLAPAKIPWKPSTHPVSSCHGTLSLSSRRCALLRHVHHRRLAAGFRFSGGLPDRHGKSALLPSTQGTAHQCLCHHADSYAWDLLPPKLHGQGTGANVD